MEERRRQNAKARKERRNEGAAGWLDAKYDRVNGPPLPSFRPPTEKHNTPLEVEKHIRSANPVGLLAGSCDRAILVSDPEANRWTTAGVEGMCHFI